MGKPETKPVISERIWFAAGIVAGAAACLFLGFLVGQYLIQAVTSSVQEPQVAFDAEALSDEVRQVLEREQGQLIQQAEEDRSDEPASGKRLYRVQVGAFSSRANAEQLADKIREEGYAPLIVNDGFHRVQVGAFSNRENAERLLSELKGLGYPGLIVE